MREETLIRDLDSCRWIWRHNNGIEEFISEETLVEGARIMSEQVRTQLEEEMVEVPVSADPPTYAPRQEWVTIDWSRGTLEPLPIIFPPSLSPLPPHPQPEPLPQALGDKIAESLTLLLCGGTKYKDPNFGWSKIGRKNFTAYRCNTRSCRRMGSNVIKYVRNEDAFYIVCICGNRLVSLYQDWNGFFV